MHPSQKAHNIGTKLIWDRLIAKFPEAAGIINPNNNKIKEMFKDQGGH